MHAISITLLVISISCLNDVKASTCVSGNTCQNGATCIDQSLVTHICICTPHWTGPLCDYPSVSTNVCPSNPCQNGATCSLTLCGGLICTCPQNVSGLLCDLVDRTTHVCEDHSCQNGGTCVELEDNNYTCICAEGWTGPLCDYPDATCDFECKNNGTCTGHNNCTCTTGFSGPTCEVQSVGLCLDDETFGAEPILLITFGHGPAQYSTAIPADFHFSTTYQQRFEPVTDDGMFSFVNSIHNDFDGVWHNNATDHSGDNGGYMYLVNADITPGQFYNGRVDNLCIGLRYEFSVYLANLCKPSGRINPNVLFEVRSVSGNVLLAQLNSGDIVKHDNLTWEKYGFSFIASDSSVNLLMISNADGGNGNDIVIDDIALNVCAHEGSGFCPTN